MTIIGILTDFGERGSHYVAEMKGVAKKINPDVEILDVSHSISPYSILEASFVLFTVYSKFPKGSIFVNVIDPGVGSKRDIVVIQTSDGYYLVGPDNGIFTYFAINNLIDIIIKVNDPDFYYGPYADALKAKQKFGLKKQLLEKEIDQTVTMSRNFVQKEKKLSEIDSQKKDQMKGLAESLGDFSLDDLSIKESPFLGSTFHGRDIMMPVSAHLSNGLDIFALGDIKDSVIQLENINPTISQDKKKITAKIQYIDEFGDIVTTVPSNSEILSRLKPQRSPISGNNETDKYTSTLFLCWNDKEIPLRIGTHFSEVQNDDFIFIPGSSGFMEIVKNQKNAAKELGLSVGDYISIDYGRIEPLNRLL